MFEGCVPYLFLERCDFVFVFDDNVQRCELEIFCRVQVLYYYYYYYVPDSANNVGSALRQNNVRSCTRQRK